MKDLEFFEIPLGPIKLEKLDVWNKQHIKAIRGLRDFKARTMCYDLKGLADDQRHNVDRSGNSYLVRDNENNSYVGYMYISDKHPGNIRVLSYIVNKKLRKSGYGTIMLNNVSEFLFEQGLASEIDLYIRKDNTGSKGLAVKCGFSYSGCGNGGRVEKFSRKR